MSFFDLVLVIIIGGFGLFGLWFGLIHTLGSLLGTILGVFLASRWYLPLADWLIKTTGWNDHFANVLVFILAFIVINRLVGFAFFLLDRALSIVTHLPFINGINRLTGLVFGVAEGVIVVGITLYFITKYPLNASFMAAVSVSHIATYCIGIASILWPLIPEALKSLQTQFPSIQ